MDKLLNDHLDMIGIKGPLADTFRAVCCYDFGPWVKPTRRRTFFMEVELKRLVSLAEAILKDGNMDRVQVFMVNEHLNDPRNVTVFAVPREQYPRLPINYHIGLAELEPDMMKGDKIAYEDFVNATHAVPVQLFAAVMGAALSRFDPHVYNSRLMSVLTAEIAEMAPLREFSATDVLKAECIASNLQHFYPGDLDHMDQDITADFIPSEAQLEHMVAVLGDDVTPIMEMHILHMLDAQRFYGENKYFRPNTKAVLVTDTHAVFFSAEGIKSVEHQYDQPEEEGVHVISINFKYAEVMLAAEEADVIAFFGGEPKAADGGILLQGDGAEFKL